MPSSPCCCCTPEKLHTPAGHLLLLGIALLLVGVAICAAAGSLRDKAKPAEEGDQPRKNATPGVSWPSSVARWPLLQNFGIAFGAPMLALATAHGANAANAANAVWMPLLMAGGGVPTSCTAPGCSEKTPPETSLWDGEYPPLHPKFRSRPATAKKILQSAPFAIHCAR